METFSSCLRIAESNGHSKNLIKKNTKNLFCSEAGLPAERGKHLVLGGLLGRLVLHRYAWPPPHTPIFIILMTIHRKLRGQLVDTFGFCVGDQQLSDFDFSKVYFPKVYALRVFSDSWRRVKLLNLSEADRNLFLLSTSLFVLAAIGTNSTSGRFIFHLRKGFQYYALPKSWHSWGMACC